jgi:uncharacterized membrane protein YphA (DoxX/SURF4 family)
MGTQTLPVEASSELEVPRWSLTTRVLFRFCFVYFGLFCLSTQIATALLPIPDVDLPDPASLWPMRQIVLWIAAHVFGVVKPAYAVSGSGDRIFDWTLAFCILAISVFGTVVWSMLDRRRENYTKLHQWFRLFIRIGLAGQMLSYGFAKAIPLQMPYPSLTRLIQPFGALSPMGVLWTSIGASQPYEVFAGCAELLAGLLLLVPMTATFGALVCLADMIQVFMLNMTYDVPVKLLSFHLILLSLVLIAPDVPRLIDVLFLNRGTQPSPRTTLFHSRRANRMALLAQLLFGCWLFAANLYGSIEEWHTIGGGRQHSPLYGIWEVKEMSVDGQVRPPLLTDRNRWRRAIFDSPALAVFQGLDDSLARYGAKVNVNEKVLALTSAHSSALFTFDRPSQDALTIDGKMDGHQIHMQLYRTDHTKLPLARGFHWIQEAPFNR